MAEGLQMRLALYSRMKYPECSRLRRCYALSSACCFALGICLPCAVCESHSVRDHDRMWRPSARKVAEDLHRQELEEAIGARPDKAAQARRQVREMMLCTYFASPSSLSCAGV